jgi:hypothetical protein
MRFLRALISALVAFVLVAVLAVVSSYLRCIVAGISYNFSIAIPIAIRFGATSGIFIFILTLMSTRQKPPIA